MSTRVVISGQQLMPKLNSLLFHNGGIIGCFLGVPETLKLQPPFWHKNSPIQLSPNDTCLIAFFNRAEGMFPTTIKGWKGVSVGCCLAEFLSI